MSTIRIARRRQYVRLDSRAVNDTALSYRARGVLAWLLEKPDDWTVNADAIAKHGTEGRDAIRTALAELEQAGYLVRRRHRNQGRWATETVVYEHPDLAHPEQLTAVPDPAPPQRVSSAGTAAGNQRRETSAGFPGPVVNTSPKGDDQPKTQLTAASAAAHAIATRVYNAKKPRPAQPFVALRSVARALLDAGWAEREVERAMMEAPTVSTRACEVARSRWPGARLPAQHQVDTDRAAPGGVVEL